MSSKTKPETEKIGKHGVDGSQNGNSHIINTNGNLLGSNPRFSRLDEKNALVGLNNRLAGIIDRNRQLESENVHLNAEVKSTEEKLQSVSHTLKTTFDNENKEIRKQLDIAEKEKAKLVLSESNVRNKLKDAEEKIKKRDIENSKLQKDLEEAKSKNKKLENDLQKEKDAVAKTLKDKSEVEDDNRKLKQENEDFKKFNEDHLLTQVELKNALKNKGEELTLKAEIHEREIKAISTKSQTFLQKIGEKAKKEFEKKLEEAIKALRKDCEVQMDQNKKEQDQLHAIKEKDLKGQIGKLTDALKSKGDEILDVSVKVEKCNKRIAELEGDKVSLEKKIKGAEDKLVKTESKLAKELKVMEKDLKDLQDDKEKLIGEYQDLMEIKVALDNEISTYRNLLEGEEDRLQILLEAPKMAEAEKPAAKPEKKVQEADKKEVIVQL